MTGTRGAFLRVGLLVSGGIVLAVWLVLFLGGDRVHNGRQFESYFTESVQGLDVGAPVKFRGVALGQVTEIGLVGALYHPPDAGHAIYRLVYVRFIIDLGRAGNPTELDTAASTGLRARLTSQGITGLAYLELDFVDPAQFPAEPVPWEPAYRVIPSVPSTLTQVQSAAERLLARINAVDIVALSRSAQRLLDDLHGELAEGGAAQQALAGTAALTTAARQAVQEADLPGLTAELRATAAGLHRLVGGPQGRAALAAVTRAADRLPALITALEATTRRGGDGVADLQADLVPVLRDARAAAANLREISEALRRYPAGVLLGGPPPREGRP